jgi:MHS family alpha-ketoglutarate permease-like MFS transporter
MSASHVNGAGAARSAEGPDRRVRTLLGIGLGNATEWFDWTAYAVFAPFFASQIFNPADPASALLATFAVFGVGFLIRPVGAIAFGWLADRHGRKVSLIAAVLCASLGMLLVAVVPTYDSVGLVAGTVLLLARLLQGVAHTGEVAAAYTYIAEVAPARRRGLWASSIYVSGVGAILVATVFGAVLTTLLSPAAMSAWGWRIPFAFGAVLGLLTLVLRRNMAETEAFAQQSRDPRPAAEKPSLWRGLWVNRAAGARVFALTAANAVFFYAWAVSGPSWAISVAGLDPTAALWAGVVAQAACVVALPVLGALSDRIGRRPSFFVFGVGAAVLALPLDRLARGGEVWQFALAMSVALVLFAFIGAIFPALLAELFPTGVRASGIALPYSLAAVVFAGTAPYLQQWLGQRGDGDVFVAYTAAVALLGAAVMYFTRETKGIDLDGNSVSGADGTDAPMAAETR